MAYSKVLAIAVSGRHRVRLPILSTTSSCVIRDTWELNSRSFTGTINQIYSQSSLMLLLGSITRAIGC